MTNKYEIPKEAQEMLNKIKNPDRKLKYKITLARKLFKDQSKSKSGSNKFQHFDYFELKDIVPEAIDICTILGLEYEFILSRKRGVVTVYDVESEAEVKFPKERPAIKDGGNINQQLQGIGKTSTYLKRYCMMDFLEVVEADKVDAEDNGEKKNKPKSAPKKTLKKQMVLDEVKQYLSENLQDQTDMVTAKKLLDELKMQKKINQAVYNKMCSDLERASK